MTGDMTRQGVPLDKTQEGVAYKVAYKDTAEKQAKKALAKKHTQQRHTTHAQHGRLQTDEQGQEGVDKSRNGGSESTGRGGRRLEPRQSSGQKGSDSPLPERDVCVVSLEQPYPLTRCHDDHLLAGAPCGSNVLAASLDASSLLATSIAPASRPSPTPLASEGEKGEGGGGWGHGMYEEGHTIVEGGHSGEQSPLEMALLAGFDNNLLQNVTLMSNALADLTDEAVDEAVKSPAHYPYRSSLVCPSALPRFLS